MARKTPRARYVSPSTSDSAPGFPSAQKGVFKEGGYWTVGCGGNTVHLKDARGLGYIAHLLRHPAVEFHVLDLLEGIASRREDDESSQSTHGLPRTDEDLEKGGIHIAGLGDAGEMLDDQAKIGYRRRLSELREELEEAKQLGNVEHAEQAENEIGALTRELSRAVGLGGRNRRAASASERARQSITKSIKSVLEGIAQRDATLGDLLSRCIRTGTFCSYQPDPDRPIAWEFAEPITEPAEQPASSSDPVPSLADQRQVPPVVLDVRPFSRAERTAFVGREKEHGAIRALIDRAVSGQGSLIMLGGGPGVGKSRLALELAEYAYSLNGFRVFVGHCYERDEPFPYLPFVEIIEGSLAQAASLDDFRRQMGNNAAELAQLAPSLRRVFPDIPEPIELAPAQRRRYVFQSVSDALARWARIFPQVLILDDLHWAEESTLALLIHLANRVSQLPLVIIGTYRDEYSEANPALVRSLEELIRLGIRPIKLNGLSKDAVGQMLNRLSERHAPENLVSAIFEESQGNPFFVEEVYRHLVEEGRVFDAGGEFRTDLRFDENDVPENVRLVLRRRLGRLTEEAKWVLTAAAVIGRSFSFELLQATLESLEVSDLLAGIEQALRRGLVVSSDDTDSALNFAHELVRQTLLIDVSRPRRERLHLAVAKGIEQLNFGRLNEQAAVLAHHLRNAGRLADAAKTASYLELAGRNALEGAAYEEAYRSFEAAASYKETDLRWRAECLQGMEQAKRGLGHWDDALRMCNETVEIYRRLGDIEMTTSGIYESAAGLLMTGRFQEAIEMARSGLAELGDEPTERRADLLAVLGSSYGVVGSYVPAKEAFNEAAAVAQRLSNPKVLARVLSRLSVMNATFLEMADSLRNSQTSLDLVHSDRVPGLRTIPLFAQAIPLYSQMIALHCLGRVEEACRITDELEPLGRKIGHLAFVAGCVWTKAWTEFGKAPDLKRLEAQLGESVEICRTARIPVNLAQSLTQVSLAKFLCGQQSSALDCALEASQLDVPGDVQGFAVGTVFRERAYAGEYAGAMALFNQNLSKLPRANQPNPAGSWAFLVSVVEGLAMLGEREQAAELYPLLCGLLDTGTISLPLIARFSRTIVGVAATAAHQWQSAEKHFCIALRQAEEIPNQLERAECRRFYGSMLLDRNSIGDREQARQLLTDALGAYTRIGMPLHIELTKALLGKI